MEEDTSSKDTATNVLLSDNRMSMSRNLRTSRYVYVVKSLADKIRGWGESSRLSELFTSRPLLYRQQKQGGDILCPDMWFCDPVSSPLDSVGDDLHCLPIFPATEKRWHLKS